MARLAPFDYCGPCGESERRREEKNRALFLNSLGVQGPKGNLSIIPWMCVAKEWTGPDQTQNLKKFLLKSVSSFLLFISHQSLLLLFK
jgi:hypothetical protein